MVTLWKAIAQANEPVRISTCMTSFRNTLPYCSMARKNGGLLASPATLISAFSGNAETNASDVMT